MAAHRSPLGIIGENGSTCHDGFRARTRMDFLQRLFNPLAYIGGAILALLGLAPVNTTQWLASHLSPAAVSWVSSDQGRWAFVVIAVVIHGSMWRRHLTRMEQQATEARKQRPPA